MSSYTSPLALSFLGKGKFKLERDFSFYMGPKETDEVYTAPKGFITDFASIPRIFWSFLPPIDEYGRAAVIHDYLLESGTTTRKKADKVFLKAMKVDNVSFWKRYLLYFGVRFYAFWLWLIFAIK